jgi:hypothetical protein
VRFRWKKDGTPSIGVIAQELERVYPELIATGPDGMKAVDYDKLAAVLIESTKELKTQQAQSTSTIAELKQENVALRARLDKMERVMQQLAAAPARSSSGSMASK